jgi:hypothetical protein
MKNVKEYYKSLGRLVYAVAMADGHIQEEERQKLHSFVLKKLAMNEHENDSSGMNKAFYVDFEFEKNENAEIDPNEVIRSYSKFIRDNYEAGDEKLLSQSIKLLKAVSLAFTERKEKDIINRVSGKIKEISANIITD